MPTVVHISGDFHEEEKEREVPIIWNNDHSMVMGNARIHSMKGDLTALLYIDEKFLMNAGREIISDLKDAKVEIIYLHNRKQIRALSVVPR